MTHRRSHGLRLAAALALLLVATAPGGGLPFLEWAVQGQEETPTSDSQIAVQTSGPRLCTNLVLQETTGVAGVPIALQALPLAAADGGSAQPRLSLTGCNDPQAADQLSVTLPANGQQAVYIGATLDQVTTYTGKLVVQPEDAAAIVYHVQATRLPRALQVSPLQAGKLTGSTLQAQFRQLLRVGLPAGQAPSDDLRYEATLVRRDGAAPVNGAAQVWLELDGARVTSPLTVTAELPLSLQLVADLPDQADYGGTLTFHFGGEAKSVELALSRGATEIALSGSGLYENGFTLNTQVTELRQKVWAALPPGADPVGQLRYSAHLARTDGAAGGEVPELALLAGGVDLNQADLSLVPGAQPAELTLVGRLPEVATYAGSLRLDLGGGRIQEIPLALTRRGFAPDEGLTFSAPAPSRWQTEPSLLPGGGGARVEVEFDLEETAGQPVQFTAPRLVHLVQVKEDGSVVDNLLGRKPAALLPGRSFTLPAGGSQTVVLAIDDLTAAGKYQATVRLEAADGRQVEGSADILVRHSPLPALVVLLLGILLAWLLQFWAGGGREHAVARWQIATVQARIDQGQAVVDQLPLWAGQDAARQAWLELRQRLADRGAVARLARSAAELSAVAEDGELRAGYLQQGLELVRSFELELGQAGLTGPALVDLQTQVHAWLAHEGMLYDRLARLEPAVLQDTAVGAAPILEQMRQRLIQLQGQQVLAPLAEAQRKLEQVQGLFGADPALQSLADQARLSVAVHLTKGAAVQVKTGDLAGAAQSVGWARADYARLLVQGMGAQLAALRASVPAESMSGPAWQAVLAAIEQAEALLAHGLADGTVDDRLRAAGAARLPFTQAQVGAARAQLECDPLDLESGEWHGLAGYAPLAAALAQAELALAEAQSAEGDESGLAHLAAGQLHYGQARQLWPLLQWDLLVHRLERQAENAPGQLPLGLAPNDPDWAHLRALAEIERDRLPDRQAFTEAALVQAAAWARGPLLKRLELAASHAAGACPLPQPVAEFRRRVARAGARHLRLVQALAAQQLGTPALLAEAEQAYEEAYSAYQPLAAASRADPGAPAGPAEYASAGVRALFLGAPWEAEQAMLAAIPPLRGLAGAARELFVAPKLIRFLVGTADGVALAVAFGVALLVGVATRVANQPTFGTFADYVTVALWGFGVGELSQYLTKATYGEVSKRVQGP